MQAGIRVMTHRQYTEYTGKMCPNSLCNMPKLYFVLYFRYGQKRACYIYRFVMDKCLEKKIYDRQIKKQGMSDRVVDECNPDAHLSIKDVTNLCYDYDGEEDKTNTADDFPKPIESYTDVIIKIILQNYKTLLTKEPFFHESLLIDRKNDKLSQAEKRQAHRSYEIQKKTSAKQGIYTSSGRVQYSTVRQDGSLISKPVASVSFKYFCIN